MDLVFVIGGTKYATDLTFAIINKRLIYNLSNSSSLKKKCVKMRPVGFDVLPIVIFRIT